MAANVCDQFGKLSLTSSIEPSPETIKEIILDAMEKEGVLPSDIPKEKSFYEGLNIRGSKRYFEKHGVGHYDCDEEDNDWNSVFSWCIIDLKKQKICYRYYEQCKKCETKAWPQFSYETIEKLAHLTVESFLFRTGRKERPERQGDPIRRIRGPHDEERCEKCIETGQRCC